MTMLFVAGALSAQAYDFPYLTVRTVDGVEVHVAVESLVLTVVDGKLVATNGDGEQIFAVENLSKMYFSEDGVNDPNAIGTVVTDDGDIDVFSIDGVFMGSFGSRAEALGTLRKGVYVMKQNGKTFKMAVK